MKKYILILIAFVVSTTAFAQEKENVKLEKKGDLVEATYYYDNGAIQQKGTFLNKKLHGIWTSYDEAGKKLAVGNYDQGKKVGKWFFWVGESLKEVDYSNNAIASVVVWKESDNTTLAVRNE